MLLAENLQKWNEQNYYTKDLGIYIYIIIRSENPNFEYFILVNQPLCRNNSGATQRRCTQIVKAKLYSPVLQRNKILK